MIVVTGCPRSGTSLMMKCLKEALGQERLFGEEFPQVEQRKRFEKKRDDETDAEYAYRLFARRTTSTRDPVEDEAKARDMNPDGFWENPFTTVGIRWAPGIHEQIDEILKNVGTQQEEFCKIVSQGVVMSDPRFISKLVLMVRDPRAVAKSQERLTREFRYRRRGVGERDLYDGMKFHSPKYFIDVTLAFAEWALNHPSIPVYVVNYDELIDSPEPTLSGVLEFLGEKKTKAKAKDAAAAVDKKLRRSAPQDVASPLWGDADTVYRSALVKDWAALSTFRQDKNRPSNRESRSWLCVRSGAHMVEAHCQRCISDAGFAATIRRAATQKGINWKVLPCAWQVAYGPEPHISIDDSIVQNHWLTDEFKKKEAFDLARLEQVKAKAKS